MKHSPKYYIYILYYREKRLQIFLYIGKIHPFFIHINIGGFLKPSLIRTHSHANLHYLELCIVVHDLYNLRNFKFKDRATYLEGESMDIGEKRGWER